MNAFGIAGPRLRNRKTESHQNLMFISLVTDSVQSSESTLSMYSMLQLGGLEACHALQML